MPLWAPDTLALRRELLPELLDSAAARGDPALEFWAANRELSIASEGGEVQRAEAAAQRQTAIAEKQGEPTMRWNTNEMAAGLGFCVAISLAGRGWPRRPFQLGADAGQPDAS